MGLSVTGYSMPIFWWGLLLIMLFAERWHLDAGRRAASTSSASTTTRRPASC